MRMHPLVGTPRLAAIVTTPDVNPWLAWLKTHGVRIAGVIVVAIVVSKVATLALRRVRRRLEGSPSMTQAINLQRAATLGTTMANVVRVTLWSLALLMILGELGLNLAPLLAGAGVVGIALGFGAQSLVRDFLAGFFILLENQFGVGDTVLVNAVGGPLEGRVESLTLRITAVRQGDGTLSMIPNGNIQSVSNKSRGRGRVTVEIDVPGIDDVEQVRHRADRLVGALREDPAVQKVVSAGPTLLDVEPLDGQVRVTIAAETRPYRRGEVEHEIRRRVELAIRR